MSIRVLIVDDSKFIIQLLAKKSVKNTVSSTESLTGRRKIELLVIVASTGDPVTIQKILPQLASSCLFPILIIQQMLENFTGSLRKDSISCVV